MTSEQMQVIPVDLITTEPQIRNVTDESLEEMIASIEEVGILQPVVLRALGKGFRLIAGERRLRAVKKLGWKTIPAIIQQGDLTEAMILQRQLIENCQRADLTVTEKGTAIARLMQATGWNAGETAKKLGISSAMATRFLALLSLPKEILERINGGQIPVTAGYELTRVADPIERAELAQQLENRELTRDGLVGKLKASGRKTADKPAMSRATAQLGEGRSVTVVASSLDLESFIAQLEDLLARARRVRPQGVELATFIAMLKDQSRSVEAS